jgi:uncharacterized damage-inducible protein DinB
MFRKMEDFFDNYSYISQGTLNLLAQLTDDSLQQQVAPGHRTLGQIAWHIVVTPPEMIARVGVQLISVDPSAPPPAAVDEIRTAYQSASEELVTQLKANWTDETLTVVDDMYGEQWPRGLTLTVIISHEIHHQGQLTVLMRQAGLKVPGVYGPAKEEWEQYGQPTPPY